MFVRSLLLITYLPLIIACVQVNRPTHTASVKNYQTTAPIVKTQSLPKFDQIMVTGRINVTLHTNYKKSMVVLRGNTADLTGLQTHVSLGKLTINAAYSQSNTVAVDIYLAKLNNLSYNGVGVIKGSQLNSPHLSIKLNNAGPTTLDGSLNLYNLNVSGSGNVKISGIKSQRLKLNIQDSAHVQLRGLIDVARANLHGKSWLDMYWIASHELTVRNDNDSFIKLAGVVSKLDLELWDQAQFDGRYLRAKQTFVKTHDRSLAKISTVDRQHTLATDASDIYFYTIPATRADFMGCMGAVLDMRELSTPLLRDYDSYNK